MMVISVSRLCGVVYPNVHWLRLKRKTVLIVLAAIWAVSISFAAPTTYYRRYWVQNNDSNGSFKEEVRNVGLWRT